MPVSSPAVASGPDHHYLSTVRVPDPLAAISPRARLTGGKARVHPLWSPVTSAAPHVTKSYPWQLISLHSVSDSAKVTFHSKRPTFSFLSHKSGRTQTGESHYELAHARECEVNPNVVDYQLHGVRMHWNADGDERIYTPDAISLDTSGVVTIHEVKASSSYFADPEYRVLMNAAETELGRIGIQFRRVSGHHMEQARRRQFNVKRAFMDRSTRFTSRQVEAVENLFVIDREQPMGRVVEALQADRRIAGAVVNAMMCARHLAYDLDLEVNDHMMVGPVSRAAAASPDIRALAH